MSSSTQISTRRIGRRSIFGNFAALSSAQVVASVTRFAYLVAIARFLDPSEVGIFTYGMAFSLALLGIAGLGQRTTLSTRIGRRPRSAERIVGYSFTATVMTLLAVAIVCIALQWAFGDGDQVSVAVTCFLVAMVARGIAIWVRSCGIALEDTSWIPRYEAVFRCTEAVLGICALAAGGGLVSICVVHASIWALEAGAGLRLLARRNGFTIRFGSKVRLLKAIVAYSLPFAVTLWLTVLTTQVGVVALKFLQPDTASVGHFAIAMQVVSVLLIGPLALGQALLPGLARAYRNDNVNDLTLFLTMIKLALVGGTVLALLTVGVGPALLTLMLGSGYSAAGEAFAIVVWAIGPLAAVILMVEALNAFGRRHDATIVAGTVILLHVALMGLLIRFYSPLTASSASLVVAGLIGAALGSVLVGQCLGFIGRHWLLASVCLSLLAAAALHFGMADDFWAGPFVSVALALAAVSSRAIPFGHLKTLMRRATSR